jgi:hypothetical protein
MLLQFPGLSFIVRGLHITGFWAAVVNYTEIFLLIFQSNVIDNPVKVVLSDFSQLCTTMELYDCVFLIQVFLAELVVFIHFLQ